MMEEMMEEMIRKDCKEHAQRDKARKSRQKPPEGVTVIKDIPYLQDGKSEHLLDVYRQEGREEQRDSSA